MVSRTTPMGRVHLEGVTPHGEPDDSRVMCTSARRFSEEQGSFPPVTSRSVGCVALSSRLALTCTRSGLWGFRG